MTTPKEPSTKENPNPANAATAAQERRRTRRSMAGHTRALEVDPIPGFYLYWFREGRVERAKEAGYELVDAKEAHVNSHRTYGGLRAAGGNTDLGSNVSIVADGSSGERLVLMKLPMADHLEDQALDDEVDAGIMRGIFSGEVIASGQQGALEQRDANQYVSKALFNRPTRKIRLMGGTAPNPAGLNARTPE